MKFNEGILAIIVLYRTKLSDSKTFLSLTEALKFSDMKLDLFVYDNSPQYNIDSSFEHDNWQITFKPDINNGGVSEAYNQGADLAVEKGKKWIMLFDQDTTFPQNTINKYIEAITNYPEDKLFAPIMLVDSQNIVSPCHFRFMRGFYLRHIDVGPNSLNKLSIINSGMCIAVEAFKKNMGYNAQIKLDFSDHDFIKRFKKTVTDRFIVITLKVHHELSSSGKNSMNSDLTRFDYYLKGSEQMSSSMYEKVFLKAHAGLRSLKLSLIHRNLSFVFKFLKSWMV
ncbi:glycosyltransferase [Mucilaginibacter pocheonensis]|uniref:GT2 family glycosyltransferase n=1 Tax=Mucilaginibacter pocheonensis TaxID=398050 RepID=A0ABU1T7I6_9SPHI|nr:glycosyltransferase [Mucilaginibacter pocheonensis]MDR6941180.1 GT2 family glycosyltransferase [Mucilaginibacter pocheonensis]